jgi:hypothetical protein
VFCSFAAYPFKILGDMKGRLPIRDERHSRRNPNGCRCMSQCCRKTAAATQWLDSPTLDSYSSPSLISRCMSIKVRFERVSLPTE